MKESLLIQIFLVKRVIRDSRIKGPAYFTYFLLCESFVIADPEDQPISHFFSKLIVSESWFCHYLFPFACAEYALALLGEWLRVLFPIHANC